MTDKKKGFNEDVDPLLGKAKKHSIVAQKIKFDKENVSKISAIVPIEEEFKTLRFKETEELPELIEQYENENGVKLQVETEDDMLIIKVPQEKAEELMDFLVGINKVRKDTKEAVDIAKTTEKVDDIEKKDSPVHPAAKPKCTTDEIIANVQRKRSKRAVASDKSKTAKRVGNKSNAYDLFSWLKNPSKIDLAGVDTPEAE